MKSTLITLLVLGTLLTDAYGIKCYDCSYGFVPDPILFPGLPAPDDRCETEGVNSIDCADECDFVDMGAKVPSFLSKFHFSRKQNMSPSQGPLIPGTNYCGDIEISQGAQKMVARSCVCIPDDPNLQIGIGIPVGTCDREHVGGVIINACTCKTDNCNGRQSETTTTPVATTTAGSAVPKNVFGSAVFLTGVLVGKSYIL